MQLFIAAAPNQGTTDNLIRPLRGHLPLKGKALGKALGKNTAREPAIWRTPVDLCHTSASILIGFSAALTLSKVFSITPSASIRYVVRTIPVAGFPNRTVSFSTS